MVPPASSTHTISNLTSIFTSPLAAGRFAPSPTLTLQKFRTFLYTPTNVIHEKTHNKHRQLLRLSAVDDNSTGTASTTASSFDLSPPPIDLDDLLDFGDGEVGESLGEASGNNDVEAIDAFYNGVAVANLSNFGRIRVSGEDRTQFLHNQTTANFECLKEGQGCDTVFVTPTARTIDIAHAWIMRNAITLVVSPGTSDNITSTLTKYIFFSDKVEIQDITNLTAFFILAGPKSNQVMNSLNLGGIVGKPYGTHLHYNVNGLPITVGVGNIISEDGFSMLMSAAAAETVWSTLLAQGVVPMGSDAWEKIRIYEGRPAPGKELTPEFNVLEAGLWTSISTSKGCYKGQETIARLITYDGVKQKLWGLQLSAPAEPGSLITVDGKKAGVLTSYAPGRKELEHVGLGYIKRKAASEGHTVTVGSDIIGQVVEVPFLKRQSLRSNS